MCLPRGKGPRSTKCKEEKKLLLSHFTFPVRAAMAGDAVSALRLPRACSCGSDSTWCWGYLVAPSWLAMGTKALTQLWGVGHWGRGRVGATLVTRICMGSATVSPNGLGWSWRGSCHVILFTQVFWSPSISPVRSDQCQRPPW